MNRTAGILLLMALGCTAGVQAQTRLRELTVQGRRPLAETGVQRTAIDSAALKQNIALSMADVLGFNSSLFVKNYGRATLSTVSFRGTSAGHTQVTWNGMPVNNPTIGSTDFSTIPAYFIDRASLLHGNSSLAATAGGLGGLVQLASEPVRSDGFKLQYVQGVGSFSTFDEYLRASYGGERWSSSTRVVFSSSANDYTYINHDKKENVYDDHHNIVASYHPRERNRSGAFRDFHALQDVYYRGNSSTAGASVWYMNSRRELPMLTTDYGDDRDFSNVQRESTLRAVASWKYFSTNLTTQLRAGYIHPSAHYDYSRDNGSGTQVAMTRSRSIVNSFYGHASGEYRFPFNLSVELSAALRQHGVRSFDDKIENPTAAPAAIGYTVKRSEFSAAATARWRPFPRAGIAAILREEANASSWSPLMPALMIDAIVWPRIGLSARASVARNYRYPAINDLYFMPGGNPDLRPEKGFSYDAGLELNGLRGSNWDASAALGWFDSRIDDWILWLPTLKGFFSPRNVLSVHAYGVEARATAGWQPSHHWKLSASASASWTPSVNVGEPQSAADHSTGKQLPYVPRRSASASLRLEWRGWALLYKWSSYSRRYTMSSNDVTLSGSLPAYYMSNAELEKTVRLKPCGLSFKLAVNNLFNEDYLSVLSRPMPGINFEFFVGVTL